jgi:hypothetical protein
MRRVAILWLFFVALSSVSAGSQDRSISFSGQVSQGQTFRKSIGHGLDFVLTPISGQQSGDLTGWTIGVSPQGQPSDPECKDFAWVVTPPYRFGNALNLDTQYDRTAQEAVRASPREFSFVLNCSDLKTEQKRVERVLWPYTYSQQDVDEALAKLGSSPLGTGRLWIKGYRITPGRKTAASVDFGAIHWIKFKVEIKFPAGLPQESRP